MLPWDFDRLTPAEFDALLLGHERRAAAAREERREELAWAVTHVVGASGWLKRPPRFEALLAELIGERRVADRIRDDAARDKKRGR